MLEMRWLREVSIVLLLGLAGVIAEPHGLADDGTETTLSPVQVQRLNQWTAGARAEIQSTLRALNTLQPSDALAALDSKLREIVAQSHGQPRETFIRIALDRAFLLEAMLARMQSNSFSTDLKLRLLYASAEMSAEWSGRDPSERASFGVQDSEFLLAWSESLLNARLQYQASLTSLELLQNDLAGDPLRSSYAGEISGIQQLVEIEKAHPPQSDPDSVVHLKSIRSKFAFVLKSLQSTPAGAAIDDPEHPALEYYRRTLRAALNDPSLDIRTGALEQYSRITVVAGDQALISTKLSDPSLSLCFAAFHVLDFAPTLDDSIADALSKAALGGVQMPCRRGAVILMGRLKGSQTVADLKQIFESDDLELAILAKSAMQNIQEGTHYFTQGYEALCSGDLCVGDIVNHKEGKLVWQCSISDVRPNGEIMMMTTERGPIWLKPSEIGRRVKCHDGFCDDDIVHLKGPGPMHKFGSALSGYSSNTLIGSAFGLDPGWGGGGTLNGMMAAEVPFKVLLVYDNGILGLGAQNHLTWAVSKSMEKFSGIEGLLMNPPKQ